MVERKIKNGILLPASVIPRLRIKLTIEKIKNLFLNFIFLKNSKIKKMRKLKIMKNEQCSLQQ